MFHYQAIVAGIFEERLHPHRGRSVTHGMADFRGDPNDLENRPLGGLVEFGVSIEPITEALIYMEQMKIRGTELWKLLKASPLRERLLTLSMHGEDAPQRRNRVDLDDTSDVDEGVFARRLIDKIIFELCILNCCGHNLQVGDRAIAPSPKTHGAAGSVAEFVHHQ